VQVYDKDDELKSLNTSVLLVTFEDKPYWINIWLEEAGADYPFLLDVERRVYGIYGLRYSKWRVWSPKTLAQYFLAIVHRKKFFYTGGDIGQMGGDFVIDGNGKILMAHRSMEPADRPSMDEIIATLKGVGKK